MYKPIKGIESKKHAEKYLKEHWKYYNSYTINCPLINQSCKAFDCVAWVQAIIALKTPNRNSSEDNIYDIYPGYCSYLGSFINVSKW